MMNEIEIGSICNTYSWEYDSWMNVVILRLDLETSVLKLTVTQIHTKSGIGHGVFTKMLDEFYVGTLKKPNKGFIRSTLAKYKQQHPFSKNGWRLLNNSDVIVSGLTLSEVLEYNVKENLIISRVLKIKAIKDKINGIRFK